MSKLQLNSDKTNVMVLNRPNLDKEAAKVKLKTSSETVNPKSQFKVLGWITNHKFTMESHINKVASIIAGKIHQFKPIAKYSSEDVRLRYAQAHLLSIVQYGLPLYSGETQNVRGKVHKIWMTIARFCKQSYCFKISTHKILKSLSLKSAEQTTEMQTAIHIHKIIKTGRPYNVKGLIRQPRTRTSAKLYPKYFSNTKILDKNIYIRGIKVYNSLPDELKNMEPKQFKKRIKSHYIDIK